MSIIIKNNDGLLLQKTIKNIINIPFIINESWTYHLSFYYTSRNDADFLLKKYFLRLLNKN